MFSDQDVAYTFSLPCRTLSAVAPTTTRTTASASGDAGDDAGNEWDDDDDYLDKSSSFTCHRFLVGSSIPSVSKLSDGNDDNGAENNNPNNKSTIEEEDEERINRLYLLQYQEDSHELTQKSAWVHPTGEVWSLAMQITRPWTTQHWCKSVIKPEWPFAYSKYHGQKEETKGRVSTNRQDVRHECDARGVQSKCHICADFACGGGPDDGKNNTQTCHFQLQGVAWDDMSMNIPTISDVPWSVNGSHRYDFGDSPTTHVCMYLSGTPPCQSSFGEDYSHCELRCWGHGQSMSGANSTAANVTAMKGEDLDGIWPNHRVDSVRGVNSTPWLMHSPTMGWNYPAFSDGNEIPHNPAVGGRYSFNPQGYVFTMAGSVNGEEGFLDGKGSDARFRHPEGVAVDHDGYVYVADTGNHAIRMISPSGRVHTITGTGSPGNEDGFASDGAQFSSPTDIAVWRDWAWWPYANPIDPDSFLYRNGNGTPALFVADAGNHRIRKISGDIVFDPIHGEKIWTNVKVECFSGRCGMNPEPGYANGDKMQSRFDSPLGIGVSSVGHVFVADTNNKLVRMIDQFGTVTTIAESDSDFNYPSDVALTSFEDAIVVTDRHAIHSVNLSDGSVTKLAGGDFEGDRDGDGAESTLNNPTSITVTGDGVLYVADSSSCRIRRVSSMSTFAPQISCDDTLPSITRQNGCSSYNNPIDKHGLTTTSVEGNIHFNYQFRDTYDIDIGQDSIGRSIKNCVGSPPMSRLDKRRWSDFIASDSFTYNLVVNDNSTHIREDPNDGTRITVRCSANCSNNGPVNFVTTNTTGATKFYSEESPICSAALHEGILDDSGIFEVTIVSESQIDNGIGETRQYYMVSKMTQDVRLQTIAGAPASQQQQSCGYRDSFPPQISKFNRPSGLGAHVNMSLDDASHLMYISDRGNNIIRGMSATCSFRCENDGRCIGPDQCQCLPGWSGIDCTKPLCQESCRPRELCVAPNTCHCIPGYQGDDCLQANCAQQCVNGHCSAPDVCTCDSGWFDPNCTTPVCEQTCGNGGDCTGPNFCTCQRGYTGYDCRTPVCEQSCSNGGWCVAPNSCQCPPGYSGFDCSVPVCHQGFFVPFHEMPGWMIDSTTKSHWLEYQPCNFTSWCEETSGFDCAQTDRKSTSAIPDFGTKTRYPTASKQQTEKCFMIELHKDAVSHFQYLSSMDNITTPHFRYSPNLPYDWLSTNRLPWNAFDSPEPHLTPPYKHQIDRQIALAAYVNLTQGAFMCANDGKCMAPDVCACAEGWIGFDCRVPVCEQGFYEPELESFVKGVESDQDFATFKIFLDPRRPYDFDSSRRFSSNPDLSVWVERFQNESFVLSQSDAVNGTRYLALHGSQFQGGYECSIRSVSQWENYRSSFIFDHPNYYSRYMDEKVEGDGLIYTHWKGMNFPPTHRKSAKLMKYGDEFLNSTNATGSKFMYTDVGYMADGIWVTTGAKWSKGHCIVEFERHCGDDSNNSSVMLVQDTDESYRPIITYDDKRANITGRWFASKADVCVDLVVRGCFNNGTCIAPNSCMCSSGWSGSDCSIPVCEHTCLHNGNCTHPNTCTCERGWSGADCSVAVCAQKCIHGKCVAPDTCKCDQWDSRWRDSRVGGGVPLFQKPNGDPQVTGYTGYDCNTPICVQAEKFSLYANQSVSSPGEKSQLLGKNDMAALNHVRTFQRGCGWDVLDTGCCFGVNDDAYTCFRCEKLFVSDHNATCAQGAVKEWTFSDSSNVPVSFKRAGGDILMCGPTSEVINVSSSNDAIMTSSRFLCNVLQWEQGDFIDDADLTNEPGVGSDFGLKSGRHIRVNYNNYYQSNTSNKWFKGPEIQGEGKYECWNKGSCIAPDTCSCKDGYGGFDCATPLCRHKQNSGDIVGCINGVCVAEDKCQCFQQESVLWRVHPNTERGLTGWTGADCSMPMCTQGYYDHLCNSSATTANEGCFRCANGGICIGPDLCQCAEGWSGYDCRTPVCKAVATPLIRAQLMTSDEGKIRIFEDDPCGMNGFSTLVNSRPRGVCSLPNKCTCSCQGAYNAELCKKLGGRHCQRPFRDPLRRSRNVLAPNEVFGTSTCFSGYEGIANGNVGFSSCHLRIYEPGFAVRHTRAIISLSTLAAVCLCLLGPKAKHWIKEIKRKRRHRDRYDVINAQLTNRKSAFEYATKDEAKKSK